MMLKPFRKIVLKIRNRLLWERNIYRARRNSLKFLKAIRNLEARVDDPIFVKVGANDGIAGDPSGESLLKSKRWRGVLVEPVPYICDRLHSVFRNESRFVIENIAISSQEGEKVFYFLRPEVKDVFPDLPVWYDQIGSFDRNHILKHFEVNVANWIEEISVKTSTLTGLVDRHRLREVHFLHIDTEGHDDYVLESLDLMSVRPWIIYIEHKHLTLERKKRICSRLSDYKILDCGDDYFACRSEAKETK